MNTEELVNHRSSELGSILAEFVRVANSNICEAAELILKTLSAGNKILVCGNGGSASDSQHFVAEMVSSFSRQVSRRGLPFIDLTSNASVVTAYSNDFDFTGVFARQVEALGKPGDLLIAFSTSGESRNIESAIQMARKKELGVLVFTKLNSRIAPEADLSIKVPSDNTQHIQECHLFAYHVISEIIDSKIGEGNLL
jgi:D-sedoheptulose 7-phosphate isomerase